MNSVHLVTREKYRVELGQKLSQVHQNTQPGPAAHTRCSQPAQPAALCAPACAYPAPLHVHAVSARLLRAPRSCCSSPSLPRALPTARLPARLPLPPPAACAPVCSLRARARAHCPLLRPSAHACSPAPTPAPQLPSPCRPTQAHNTVCIAIQTCCPLNFIAIQFPPRPATSIAIQTSPLTIQFWPSSHNTRHCIATQFHAVKTLSLQYKILYCNTISSP